MGTLEKTVLVLCLAAVSISTTTEGRLKTGCCMLLHVYHKYMCVGQYIYHTTECSFYAIVVQTSQYIVCTVDSGDQAHVLVGTTAKE